ncbi:glycosyltransferase family protein [Winogradskyella helgolandensis]|uniref:hypothetical protein n=1 Tax=Winogradskyella helgolandensis TaxID=2697010 RepID=UPI0015BF1A88|nr:hypothetical protein [Winogradskyella helgolandensis]
MYPPLINILSYLDEHNIDYRLLSNDDFRKTNSKTLNKLLNFWDYFGYTIKCFFFLIRKPKNVLYFESVSAVPLAVYNRFFGLSKNNILVHYHEYFSVEDYKRQSFFERLGRKYELPLLKKATWISHTNEDRLNLFKEDFSVLDKSQLCIMPNYPSEKWLKVNRIETDASLDEIKEPIRLVHIGSLSFEALFLNEVLDYFGNDDRFTLDFYSRTDNVNIIDRINSYNNINFLGSIDYNNITDLNGKYDIGLVLYKGNSLNFTFNAPNKIFEYLALNMDVWCSSKLLTANKHMIKDSFPKMLMVDYENLNSFDITKAIERKGLFYKSSPYICEVVYNKLLVEINNSLKV